MARKTRLTDPQDRRLRRIAREKGLVCPDCGSSEPVSKEGGELKDRPDGGLEVPVRCEACDGTSEIGPRPLSRRGRSARLSLVGMEPGNDLRFSKTSSS